MVQLSRYYLNAVAAVLGALFIVLGAVACSAEVLADVMGLFTVAFAMALVAALCRLCAVLVERSFFRDK